jgi:hypothetical protein
VVPAQIEPPLVGCLPQPDVERHRPALQEVIHPPHHLQLGLLHDVGGVQPSRQARVEADLEERPQARPVAFQELIQGLPVPLLDLVEQVAGFGRVQRQFRHGGSPIGIPDIRGPM